MYTFWLTFLLVVGQAPAPGPEIRPVAVPAELSLVTSNPELSGLVWSKARKRYLVVTDDSGLRAKGTNHQPLLLGMTEDGKLDRSPIAIRGVDTINDPESICSGPDGTYFLVTSHSPNHANKTSRARRQLLHLKEAGEALQVIGRLDLTLVEGPRSLLSLLGLPEQGRLDIEAITFHDQSLFVGFKSPLGEGGSAVVARLAHPLAAMRAGKIAADDITRFLALPLCVDSDAHKVCQGISDMSFLPDGSLVLAANAPKGGPRDHGGSVWHLPLPLGKSRPVLLQRFLGLKPEGLTLSPSGHSLVVLFDCDQEQPKWTQLPVP